MSSRGVSNDVRGSFYLPDFCTPRAALAVVLIVSVTSLVLTLARSYPRIDFLSDLARTAFFGPPRQEFFAASAAKKRARTSGVSFATWVGCRFAASQVESEVPCRRYCPMVCADRPSASS